MIVCKACGNRNPDGEDFCSSCGRYLAWSGEHVDDDVAAPEQEPERDSEPEAEARPGFFTRLRIKLGFPPKAKQLPETPAPETPAPETAPETANSPAPAAADEVASGEEEGTAPALEGEPPDTVVLPVVSEARPGDGEEVADTTSAVALSATATGALETAALASGSAAGAAGLSDAPSTAPRRPGEAPPAAAPPADNGADVRSDRGLSLRRPTELPRRERTQRRAGAAGLPEMQMTPSPGDVFCPVCGQFNSPTRVYCRRCGTKLPRAEDEVAPEYVPISFFHRHFPKDTEIVPAGQRPGRWGRTASGGLGSERYMRWAARAGAFLVGAGIILSFLGPIAAPLRTWYENFFSRLRSKVDITYIQQFAIGANATTSYPNHPAGNAVDDGNNTYWQSLPSKTVHGAGQAITAVFGEPTNIYYIGILSGAGPSQQTFLSEARPKDILITFFPKKAGQQRTETLKDVNTFQHLNVKAKNAQSVTVKVLTVYPSPKGNSVAITEIEFFERS